MIKIDPSEPTAQENEDKAITKLRYMQVGSATLHVVLLMIFFIIVTTTYTVSIITITTTTPGYTCLLKVMFLLLRLTKYNK